MTDTRPPIEAYAQFFDDIRIEITGKMILIGQYVGDLVLIPGPMILDRLSVLFTARWPRETKPKQLGIRVEIPGQPHISQVLPAPAMPDFTNKPISPFAGVTVQGIIQLRFPPLRIGDIIDVWIQADDYDIPAGRLNVIDQAMAARSLTGEATGAPMATVT